ncbi:MAG: histidine kinase N-terminal 7TM domain-containing protein [Parcubacteria group bacterium]
MVNVANFLPGIILLLIAGFEIGLFVFFWRYEKTITIKAYLAFIAGVILWVGANGVSLVVGNGDVSSIQKFTFLGGALITSDLLLFIYCFPYPRSKFVYVLKYLPFVSMVLFGLWLFTGNSFIGAESIDLQDGVLQTHSQSAGILAWSVFLVVAWMISAFELIRRFLSASGVDRKRLYYLLVGVSISGVVGIVSDVIFPLVSLPYFAWLGSGFSIVWLWFSVKAVRV